MSDQVRPNEDVGWYYKDAKDQPAGPIPISQLRKLLSMWPYGPTSFVSTDKATWMQAYKAGFFPNWTKPDNNWWRGSDDDTATAMIRWGVLAIMALGLLWVVFG